MFEKIPEFIDPVHSAEHNKRFIATVKQSDLKRLKQQLVKADGLVEVDLEFKRHPKLKSPTFTLKVKTALCLECQRTLEPFMLPVDTAISGVFVSSLALAEDLSEDIEVYELPDDKVSTYELIEEELLLSLPMVPRQDGEILSWQAQTALPEELDEVDDVKPNPFAQLQQLRT
jgi:uncharacterized protein